MTGASRQPDDQTGGCPHAETAGVRAAAATAQAHLKAHEDALVDQSIAFAKTNGYAPYTTTIRAAWVEAVRSLTEAIAGFLDDLGAGPRGPLAELKYRNDPRFTRMRMIARKHRSLGITLEMYLGLFKHFRRVYLDSLGTMEGPGDLRTHVLERTLDFFDEAELSVTADWTEAGGDDRLKELQAQARTLTLAKDRYIAIFESLRNPACLLDRSRGLVHANQAAHALFHDETEAGDSLYRHDRRGLVARIEEMLGDVLEREDNSARPVWIETVAGPRCFDARVRRLHDVVENTALGFLVQLYDVTAYREATETAQRAEQQKSRFLATMSHEIRTPLHAVLGAAGLMRQSGETARDTYLDVIQSAGQALLHTLNNVLDYSKLENGPPTPRPVDTEIRSALQSFCGMAVVGPEAGWTRLSLAIAPDMPAHVRIDWSMTHQVLTNLVSNALRHDGGDGVVLRVGPVGAHVRFEVVDHGPGLPASEAEALFRAFHEVTARPTRGGGSGLGLAISRFLVEAMDGSIDYVSTANGTRIWFDLPFTEVAVAVAASKTLGDPHWTAPRGRRCLLVDDDEIGAPVTIRQLETAGFHVDHAGSVEGGRAAFAAQSYDAVVIDYMLPDGTGPELLADLRRMKPGSETRFVALTANVEALHASQDLRAGFARVLAKPTDSKCLAEALSGQSGAREAVGPVEGGSGAPCDGLEGLSAETVAAMAAAFALQWEGLRRRLADARHAAGSDGLSDGLPEELADLVHRLAGSTAQLGLAEFEAPLRELEARLDAGERTGLGALLDRIDRPLADAASWRRLQLEPVAT